MGHALHGVAEPVAVDGDAHRLVFGVGVRGAEEHVEVVVLEVGVGDGYVGGALEDGREAELAGEGSEVVDPHLQDSKKKKKKTG